MPAAVLDFDVQQIPPTINGLEGYEQALVLLRLHKRPVGQVWVPVRNGCVVRTELLDLVKRTWGWHLWEQMLREYLGWDEVDDPLSLPPATVAVTTRDRPEDLKRCLDALMKLPDDGQEYVVIDNCPATDATQQLVASYGSRMRYVREDRPGSSAARNRALREAQHEIVAFSDDDAVPDPGWLRALLRNFSDPLVLCVTGLTMPLELETEAQKWFELYSPHGRGFSRVVFDFTKHSVLNVAPIGVSANMALRRSVMEHIGLFDEALGPGTPTRAGEDYELFSRILSAGYRIIYDPAALSWHRHRRTWQELCQIIYGYGVAVYAFWARSLLAEKEWSVPKLAWGWFRYKQLPNLVRALLRRSNRIPLNLLLAELCGCVAGPWAYLSSRRRLCHRSKQL
jgi:GT2 family glycosyltransferase